MKGNKVGNKFTFLLLIVYLAVTCWILLFKMGVEFSYMTERKVNLIPFGDPSLSNGKTDFGEIIMNMIIFVPLGIYSGVLFKRWGVVKNIIFFFLISLFVETAQYVLRIGAFDVTDIINNTIGGIVGLVIFKAIEKLFNTAKAQKLVNIIAGLGTVLMVVFLILLKTNSLGIRYQ